MPFFMNNDQKLQTKAIQFNGNLSVRGQFTTEHLEETTEREGDQVAMVPFLFIKFLSLL